MELSINRVPKKGEEYYSEAENLINIENRYKKLEVMRQVSIGKYFADFYYPENKVVLEVDGRQWHSTKKQVEHDMERNRYMNDNGYCVVRVSGSMVKNNAEGIVNLCSRMFGNRTHYVNSDNDIAYIYRILLELSEKE